MSLPPLHTYRHQPLAEGGQMKPTKPASSILWPQFYWEWNNESLFSKIDHVSTGLPRKLYICERKGKKSMGLQSLCKGHIIGMLRAVDWLCEQTMGEMESLVPTCACRFVLLVLYTILKDSLKLSKSHFSLLQMRDQNWYPIPPLTR